MDVCVGWKRNSREIDFGNLKCGAHLYHFKNPVETRPIPSERGRVFLVDIRFEAISNFYVARIWVETGRSLNNKLCIHTTVYPLYDETIAAYRSL